MEYALTAGLGIVLAAGAYHILIAHPKGDIAGPAAPTQGEVPTIHIGVHPPDQHNKLNASEVAPQHILPGEKAPTQGGVARVELATVIEQMKQRQAQSVIMRQQAGIAAIEPQVGAITNNPAPASIGRLISGQRINSNSLPPPFVNLPGKNMPPNRVLPNGSRGCFPLMVPRSVKIF